MPLFRLGRPFASHRPVRAGRNCVAAMINDTPVVFNQRSRSAAPARLRKASRIQFDARQSIAGQLLPPAFLNRLRGAYPALRFSQPIAASTLSKEPDVRFE
jgi:hypothetical protein